MIKSNTDFFFLIILITVVSAFIGLNIVSIVDKKIKNLSINMPKITVPPAEVTINIENDNDDYKISCTNKPIKKKINKQVKKNFEDKDKKSNNVKDRRSNNVKDRRSNNVKDRRSNNVKDRRSNNVKDRRSIIGEIRSDENSISSENEFDNLMAFNINEYQ